VNTCLITGNIQKSGSSEHNRKRSRSLWLTVLACLGKNRSVQKAEIAILHTPVERGARECVQVGPVPRRAERMIKRDTLHAIMNPRTTIGVLTETEVLQLAIVQGKRVLRSLRLPRYASEVSGLVKSLWQADLTEVWVMSATTLSQTVTCVWFEQVHPHWTTVVHPAPGNPDRPACVLLWPSEGSPHTGRRLALVFPEHDGWGWVLPDAKSLLASVTYLDQVLGRTVADAPELVAHQLLTELTADQPTTSLRASQLELPHLPTSDGVSPPILQSAREFAWMRPLLLAEQRQRYLHKYIHLSLVLEAAMSIYLGAGVPQHSPAGRAYDGRRPGLWRVEAEPAGSLFDGRRLPSCLKGEWMSTPQVQCCRTIGYQVRIREGYAWQEAYPVLQRWATTLWQAAERLQTRPQFFRHVQARANASCTITKLAERGVALLAQGQAAGGWGRPAWWASLVGSSQAALFAQLVRLVRKGTMPVLVAGDALWVVSNDPDPLTAVPGLATARRWQGYSVGYTDPLPLSEEVQAAFRTTGDARHLGQRLDTLARDVFP
jgi:hypothetical protein